MRQVIRDTGSGADGRGERVDRVGLGRCPVTCSKSRNNPRLVHITGVGAELEPREAKRLHLKHGGAFTDLTELRRLALPLGGNLLREGDHGQVGAVVAVGIGPPRLGFHVDLGALANI